MSDSNRHILAAFAGISALITATGFGAYYGSIHAPEKRHYQSVGTNSGQAYPADSPRNGLADVTGIDTLTESTIAKPQPRNTDERQNRDLAAQESMAVFAYWMFWAMMLQTFLAGGALVMLIKDLRQNKGTAEAQLRAYVSVKPEGLHLDARNGTAHLNILVANHGQTPAFNCVWAGNIKICTFDEIEEILRDVKADLTGSGRANPAVVANGAEITGSIQNMPTFTDDEILKLTDRTYNAFTFGFAWYQDAFGKWRRTRFSFYCENLARPDDDIEDGVPSEGTWLQTPFFNDMI